LSVQKLSTYLARSAAFSTEPARDNPYKLCFDPDADVRAEIALQWYRAGAVSAVPGQDHHHIVRSVLIFAADGKQASRLPECEVQYAL
jgi:hypothetical protein